MVARLELYFLGLLICLVILFWAGKEWFTDKRVKKKIQIIYLIGFFTMFISFFPSVNAYEWCEKEGYQYCVEQKELINNQNLTSMIAINIYDSTGENYDTFMYRGFAIGGLYADVYYEGEELYYMPNLSSWDEACDENTFCSGMRINQNEMKNTYTLANLHEEYDECPLFVSVKCDYEAEWCEWAGIGWMKPPVFDCVHIRVAECFFDEDCLPEEYCDKTDNKTWRSWACKEIPANTTINPETRTKRSPEGYTIGKPSAGGYSPEYDINDVKKSFIDLLIGIIKGIGGWFS
jgi:hypothetical protein